MNIQYGLMLDTDITDTDDNFGLYNGSFCWSSDYDIITAFSNAPINPVTLSAQDKFKSGFLLRGQIGSPSFSINLEELGSYGEVGGLDFAINNTDLIFQYFRTNIISLYRRKVQFFAIIEEVFFVWWTGIVESLQWNELQLKIKCIDASKEIHKTFPPDKTDDISFPEIRKENIGKPIPVCIGKVTHASMIDVAGNSESQIIYNDGTTGYYTTKISAVTTSSGRPVPTQFSIETGSLSVEKDQFAGMWITCLRNGPDQLVRIKSNAVSNAGKTSLTLEKGFSTDGKTAIQPVITGDKIWFVEIVVANSERIFSSNPVFSIEGHDLGYLSPNAIEIFDKDSGEFFNANGAVIKSQKNGLDKYSPRPGFKIRATDPSGTSLNVGWTSYFQPSDIIIKSISMENSPGSADTTGTSIAGRTFPADESSCPNLFDRNNTTKYTVGFSSNSGNPAVIPGRAHGIAVWDIKIPEQTSTKKINQIGVNFNYELGVQNNTLALGITTYLEIFLVDIFGVESSTPVNFSFPGWGRRWIGMGSRGPSGTNVVIDTGIGKDYFDGSINAYIGSGGPSDLPGLNSIGDTFKNLKSLNTISAIRIKFHLYADQASPENDKVYQMNFTLKEVVLTLAEYTQISFTDLFTKVKGEMISGTWNSRKTSGSPVLSPMDAVEFIMRQYDLASSHIDTDSFDAVNTLRPSTRSSDLIDPICIGKQILDQKNSVDFINELCEHGMFCIVPLHNGKRAARAWIDQTTSNEISEDIIIEDSLGDMQDISMRKCWNQFELNYNFNPATNKHDSQIGIKNIDQASFPDEAQGSGNIITITLGGASGDYLRLGTDLYFTTLDQSVDVGMVITLIGGANSIPSIVNAEVLLAFTDSASGYRTFKVIPSVSISALTNNTSYSAGTLTYYSSKIKEWKKFSPGLEDYSLASEQWNNAKTAFNEVKTINTMKMNCSWFPSLMNDWGELELRNESVVTLLKKMIKWLPFPKKRLQFRVPINTTTILWELAEAKRFIDQKLTASVSYDCWIQRLRLNPETDQIEIEILVSMNLT